MQLHVDTANILPPRVTKHLLGRNRTDDVSAETAESSLQIADLGMHLATGTHVRGWEFQAFSECSHEVLVVTHLDWQ